MGVSRCVFSHAWPTTTQAENLGGIWRVIRGWLDPVVAAKVHFTNYKAGLEEFIDPSHIIKELEGDEEWEYKYEEPREEENAKMKETDRRDTLLSERKTKYAEFEEETRKWIRSPDSEEGRKAKAKREGIAEELQKSYWKLDPYLRSRSLYDRQGIIQSEGQVNWYKPEDKENAAPKTNGTECDAPATAEPGS